MYAIRVNKNTTNQVQIRTHPVRSDSDLVSFFIGVSKMQQIQLTQNRIALVDDSDYKELSKHKWCAAKRKSGDFVAVRQKLGKTVIMHRKIMNAPKNLQVDHRNHQTLDNRRCNLRLCTNGQNQHNRRLQGGASQYKGVVWHKRDKKWCVNIRHNSQRIWLGYFDTEIDAAKAYDAKAKILHGEFAYLNNQHAARYNWMYQEVKK